MKTRNLIAVLLVTTLPGFSQASGAMGSHSHGENKAEAMMEHGGHEHEDEHNSMVGQPGDPKKVSRTIEINMNDNMRFTPDKATIKAGDTVRFVVKNQGKLNHELVIGSMAELKEHAEMMRNMPAMKHAEPNMLSLAPGQQGRLVWEFDQPGTIDFACLVPGHMEAGMKGKIQVQ